MNHRSRGGLVAFVFLFTAPFASAQCPSSPPVIPNFRAVANASTSFTFGWDAPPGAAANAAYEILRETDANYCSYSGVGYVVVDTTTATSYTAALPTPNSAYAFFVRLASDHCVITPVYLVVDNFTSLPNKPATPSAVAGPSSATLTFSYTDSHAFQVFVYRAVPGGQFSAINAGNPIKTC